MEYEMSFQERARLAAEQLSKQKPTTWEKAREQALWVKTGRNCLGIISDKLKEEMFEWFDKWHNEHSNLDGDRVISEFMMKFGTNVTETRDLIVQWQKMKSNTSFQELSKQPTLTLEQTRDQARLVQGAGRNDWENFSDGLKQEMFEWLDQWYNEHGDSLKGAINEFMDKFKVNRKETGEAVIKWKRH